MVFSFGVGEPRPFFSGVAPICQARGLENKSRNRICTLAESQLRPQLENVSPNTENGVCSCMRSGIKNAGSVSDIFVSAAIQKLQRPQCGNQVPNSLSKSLEVFLWHIYTSGAQGWAPSSGPLHNNALQTNVLRPPSKG